MNTPPLLVVLLGCLMPLVAQQSLDFPDKLAEFVEEPDDLEIAADLDLDGDIDFVAFATLGTSAVKTSYSVRLRNAHGIWQSLAAVPLPTGSGRVVAYANVDGDAFGDLVLSTWSDHPNGPGLAIHLGQAGGTFGAPIHVALPDNVIGLRAGNANGDGIADLLVSHVAAGAMRLQWILGDANHTFPLGPHAIVAASPHMAIVDADMDGLDDVAHLDVAASAVNVLRTQAGGLLPHLSWPMPSGTPRGLLAIDWEQDGRVDLFASFGNGSMETWVRFHNQAAWTFEVQVPMPMPPTAVYFAGDWNADGLTDILARSQETAGGTSHVVNLLPSYVPWLAGGGGAYTVNVADGSPTMGAGLVDANGDGHLDWVDSKAILFGDGDFDGGVFTTPDTMWAADHEGDGDLDAGLTMRNDGRGNFVHRPITWAATPPPGQMDLLVAEGDLEGDGFHESLVGRYQQVGFQFVFLEMRLLQERPDAAIVDLGPAAAPGQQAGRGLFDDADGDGATDYIDAQGVWRNNGASFFSLTPSGVAGYRPTAKGDFDGDGDVDLLGQGPGGSALLVRIGPSTYAATIFAPGTTTHPDEVPLVADLDDDGDLDVVQSVLGFNGSRIVQMFSNTGGTLSLVHAWSTTASGSVVHLCHGDLNEDGATDFAYFSTQYSDLVVRHRVGPGLTYTQPLRIRFGSPNTVTLFGDLDQDGDLDLCGHRTVWNRRFDGNAAGYRRQYGTGSAGTGLYRPLLSVTGVIREGLTPAIRLRHGLGGSAAILLVGTSENNAPSSVLPGVTAYVGGLQLLLGFGLTGAVGMAGTGGLDLPVAIPAGLGGTTLFFEALVLDPAVPGWLTFSNGVEFHVGQ